MDTTLILIIGGALAVIMLVVGLVVSITSERAEVENRLGRYAEAPRTEAERGSQTPVADWLNKRVISWPVTWPAQMSSLNQASSSRSCS